MANLKNNTRIGYKLKLL